MRATNLGLKFVLEVVALILLAFWGAHAGRGVWSVVLAVLAPAGMVLVWGRFAAPRSSTRLAAPLRIPLELTVFALAAVAAYSAGARAVALGFVAAVVINAIGLSALGQWEQ